MLFAKFRRLYPGFDPLTLTEKQFYGYLIRGNDLIKQESGTYTNRDYVENYHKYRD
jgi:hypothetical protein